tara:strand:+ start:657 stop:863 length:207 start_codon:yes stop_codon:yes gene_type:complete
MSFNVGDVVMNFGSHYFIVAVSGNNYKIRPKDSDVAYLTWFEENCFTLVTPTPPVLTGMTQFFKDKEK